MYPKDYWLKREAEARLLASSMSDPEMRRVVLAIAEGYRRLAARAETRDVQQLIDGAAFGPDALKTIWEAFDLAWLEVAPRFGDDETYIEAVRYQLATALLSVAYEDSRDALVLKKAALQRMALDYPPR
jgi:hypothetical protein